MDVLQGASVRRPSVTDARWTTLTNLVPVLGFVFLGWQLGAVLLLYWFEGLVRFVRGCLLALFTTAPVYPDSDHPDAPEVVEAEHPLLEVGGAAVYRRNVFAVLFTGALLGVFWLGWGQFIYYVSLSLWYGPHGEGAPVVHDLALGAVAIVLAQTGLLYRQLFVDRAYGGLTPMEVIRSVTKRLWTVVAAGTILVFSLGDLPPDLFWLLELVVVAVAALKLASELFLHRGLA